MNNVAHSENINEHYVQLCNWCLQSNETCSHRAKLMIVVHNDVFNFFEIEGPVFNCVFYTCLGAHASLIVKKIIKINENISVKTIQVSIYEMKEYNFQKVKYNKPQTTPAYDKVSIDVIRNISFYGKGKTTEYLRNNNFELHTELDTYPLFVQGQSTLDFYVSKVKDRIQKLEKLLYNYKGEKQILKKEGDLFFTHLVFYENNIGKKLTNIKDKIKKLQEIKVFTFDELVDETLISRKYRYTMLSARRKDKKISYENIKKEVLENLLKYIEDVIQFSLPIVNKKTVYSSECSICMEDVDNEKKGGQLQCRHAFHNECIKKWFSKNTACPVCRAKCDNCLYKCVKVNGGSLKNDS
jgi:hypothetical protein